MPSQGVWQEQVMHVLRESFFAENALPVGGACHIARGDGGGIHRDGDRISVLRRLFSSRKRALGMELRGGLMKTGTGSATGCILAW